MSGGSYVVIFFITMVIVIVLYNKFKFRYKKPLTILMEGTKNIDKDFEKLVLSNQIMLPDIKNGDDLGMSFAFKIFIDNAMENRNWGRRFDQLKSIIKYSPSIHYHPLENYFSFGVEVKDNVQFVSIQSVKYIDPPLQTWLSIVVIFSSNRIQVYSNGELVVNKKLRNPPIFKSKDLNVGEKNNNFFGKLGPVLFWPYPLNPTEVPNATAELELH